MRTRWPEEDLLIFLAFVGPVLPNIANAETPHQPVHSVEPRGPDRTTGNRAAAAEVLVSGRRTQAQCTEQGGP